jgi:hypothetical protein
MPVWTYIGEQAVQFSHLLLEAPRPNSRTLISGCHDESLVRATLPQINATSIISHSTLRAS